MTFCRTRTRLWLAYGYFKQRQLDVVAQILPDTSPCQQNGYYFLFTRPTLLGPVDERMFVPLLLHARQLGWRAAM